MFLEDVIRKLDVCDTEEFSRLESSVGKTTAILGEIHGGRRRRTARG